MMSSPVGRMDAQRIQRFFAPYSIALVGASDNSAWSQLTYDNLRAGEFAGEIYCVNPRRETAHGQKSYPNLLSLPGKVDLAYLLVGTDAVLPVMAEAVEAGITNLAIMASGFAEAGPEGQGREQQLTEFARQHGQLVFGPNNLGFINASANVMAFSGTMVWPFVRGGVSLLSQSGGLGCSALEYFGACDIGVNCVFTIGNEAIINLSHCMEYLIEDPNTRVIALLLESIREPDEFTRLATRALEMGKPVVAYKIGRSQRGARAAAAHTGALAGDDQVNEAVFRQLGVIRVDSLEDLVVTSGLVDSHGALRGSRVGALSGSGALCGVISDIAERDGIRLPDLSADTVERLAEILPPFATVQNPLDVTAYSFVDRQIPQKALEALVDDPNLDVVVICLQLSLSRERLDPSRDALLRRVAEWRKAAGPQVILINFSWTLDDFGPDSREYREELGLPLVLPGVEKGLAALGHALWWSKAFARSAERPVAERAHATRTVEDGDSGSGAWSEVRAREHLVATGVPVVPGELVDNAEAAVAAACRAGYPVVLKAVSAGLQHKSDIGAVALDLAHAKAVRSAFQQVSEAASAHASDLEGVLVTPMRRGGVELIVGVTRDAMWGPVLMVGLGGIWVEVLRDAALRLLPASRVEIRSMLDELKASVLLRGARGQEPTDLDVLTDAICCIGDAALALGDRLETLEVNPLRVAGTQAEALDVLVTWRDDAAAKASTATPS